MAKQEPITEDMIEFEDGSQEPASVVAKVRQIVDQLMGEVYAPLETNPDRAAREKRSIAEASLYDLICHSNDSSYKITRFASANLRNLGLLDLNGELNSGVANIVRHFYYINDGGSKGDPKVPVIKMIKAGAAAKRGTATGHIPT